MTRKKSADQPLSSSPTGAQQNPSPVSSRARGSSPKAVTHKHKQNPATLPQPAPAEIASSPTVQPPAAVAFQPPTHEEISLRAYFFAEARGFQGGSPEDDWFRAERELLAERK